MFPDWPSFMPRGISTSEAGSSGAIRTTTLRAYDHEEMSGVLERFGQQLSVRREEKVEAGALRSESLFMSLSL